MWKSLLDYFNNESYTCTRIRISFSFRINTIKYTPDPDIPPRMYASAIELHTNDNPLHFIWCKFTDSQLISPCRRAMGTIVDFFICQHIWPKPWYEKDLALKAEEERLKSEAEEQARLKATEEDQIAEEERLKAEEHRQRSRKKRGWRESM